MSLVGTDQRSTGEDNAPLLRIAIKLGRVDIYVIPSVAKNLIPLH